MALVLLVLSVISFVGCYFCVAHRKSSLDMDTVEFTARVLGGSALFIIGWTLFHGAMEVARNG